MHNIMCNWWVVSVESKHEIHCKCYTHTHTHRTVHQLDEAPIVDAENGIIAENGIHDDSSLEKQKFEDNL